MSSNINPATFTALSLGGSLIVPGAIDTDFLKKFREMIISYVQEGRRFLIVTGGGSTARVYQNAAQEVATIDNEDRDWLGIHVTRLNAHLMRTIFKELAHPKIYWNPEEMAEEKDTLKESIIIGAGSHPGWSTDYVAVTLAHELGATRVANLSNVDYVYDDDPKKNPDAKPVKALSWEAYRAIIPTEWTPGLNSPFDPVASRAAYEAGMQVAIINGADLSRLRNFLEGEPFEGTMLG